MGCVGSGIISHMTNLPVYSSSIPNLCIDIENFLSSEPISPKKICFKNPMIWNQGLMFWLLQRQFQILGFV